MKSLFVTCQLFLVVGLLSLSGCSDNSADGLMKQQIKEMNNMADAMEAGNVEAEKEGIEARTKEIADKFKALNLTAEQKQALADKYKDELQRVSARIQAVMMKEMQKAMSGMSGQMGDAMEKMQQSMPKSFGQ